MFMICSKSAWREIGKFSKMTTNTLCRPAMARRTQAGRHETVRTLSVPFRSAAEAWFWTMGALLARREGSGRSSGGVPRPCDPDDVVKSLDRLYCAGKIQLRHARILRIWGERQTPPDASHPGERVEFELWNEALARLEWPLRIKGIVG